MDYDKYLNELGICRKPSPIRTQQEKFVCAQSKSGSDPVYLTGGLPNSDTFPAVQASFQLRDGTTLELGNKAMRTALQYDSSTGYVDLVSWIYELQRQVHNPPTYNNSQHPGKMGCILTNGSQHGLAIVFGNLVAKGDYCLLEKPAYAGTIAILRPLQPNVIEIETDEYGIIPSKLRKVLSRWNPSTIQQPGKDGPKLLYCVPTLSNPTGASLTLDRKKEIYQLAKEYQFLIVEDDPYFFLKDKPMIPSFLSLDTDGRVIRMDTMSKLVSAGIRIGMVTGPFPIIDLVKFTLETSVQITSGLSQHFLFALLKKWGYKGFYENAEKLTEFYKTKKNECVQLADRYLKDVAEWDVPGGGMFLWIKLKVKDANPVINKLIETKSIFIAPGSYFIWDTNEPCPYVRVAFSNASTEQLSRAFQSLSEVIKEYWKENKD